MAVRDGQSWSFPAVGLPSLSGVWLTLLEPCRGRGTAWVSYGEVALDWHSLRCLQQPQEGAWGPGEARDYSCGMQGRILAGEVVATATGRLCGMILFAS